MEVMMRKRPKMLTRAGIESTSMVSSSRRERALLCRPIGAAKGGKSKGAKGKGGQKQRGQWQRGQWQRGGEKRQGACPSEGVAKRVGERRAQQGEAWGWEWGACWAEAQGGKVARAVMQLAGCGRRAVAGWLAGWLAVSPT